MVRTQFIRSRPEAARKHPDSDSKRGFKPEPVLTEDIQGSQKAVPEGNKTFRLIAKTAKKAWRFAVLTAPVLPACSAITNNDKIHAGTVSLATIGIMAVSLGIICAGAEGVRAVVNYVKNKKTKQTESA